MTHFLLLTALLVGATTTACRSPEGTAGDLAPASARAQRRSARVAFEVRGMKKTKSGAT